MVNSANGANLFTIISNAHHTAGTVILLCALKGSGSCSSRQSQNLRLEMVLSGLIKAQISSFFVFLGGY